MSELIISPKCDANTMMDNMRTYQELVDQMLDQNDVIELQGKKFLKKSGWQKLSVPFNISTSIVEERTEKLDPEDNTKIAYHFTVRAEVPNVRAVDEIGSCDNVIDRPGKPIHIIRTMAKTRATSRAIAALLGKSEQSAEDMESIPAEQTPKQAQKKGSKPPSEKQLNYIRMLDANRKDMPDTMEEAAELISQLKNK